MNRIEIQNAVRAQLSGVTPEAAKNDISLLKADPVYQDQRMLFGEQGERARCLWDELHKIAYPGTPAQ